VTIQDPAPNSRATMFFAALGMIIVPFMFLWAVFRVITGSAFWRRAFKYWFVILGVVIVAAMLASLVPDPR
jgi:hypothetical protein